MSRKSSRRRGKRKALKQLEFQFLDYERSAVLAGFISVRQPGEVYGRRQRALFALPFLGERLTEFASVIDRRKPLIPAVAARLGVSPAAIRYLRNFSASELQALGYPLEEMARAAEAVRLTRASAQLLGEAARRLRLLRQISQAVGIPEAEMVSRAAVLERLPECHPGGDLTAPLATVYQHLFLPELFIVSRIEGRQPTPALVDSLTKRPPPRVWAALGQAFYGQKGPAAILETIASWNAGGGQPLSTPGGEPAMEQLRKIPLWGGLLPKSFSTGALRVRSLTSVPELIEEGLALRHCIARYAIGCAYYDRHVLGITTSAGYRLSTALVQLSPEGEVRLTEHRGYGNSAPDSRTAEALALALAEIRRTPRRAGCTRSMRRSFASTCSAPIARHT
jgi:hypothetical protein